MSGILAVRRFDRWSMSTLMREGEPAGAFTSRCKAPRLRGPAFIPPQRTCCSRMGAPALPQFLSYLSERDVREVASSLFSNSSLVSVLGEPLSGELFDDSRSLATMEIKCLLKFTMLTDGSETRIETDVLR